MDTERMERTNGLIQRWLGKQGEFWKNDVQKSVKQYFEDTSTVDGVIRWNKSNNVPPTELLELWAYVGILDRYVYQKSLEVRDAELAVSIRQYKEARAKQGYSQEQLFEMRAAFGAGATVVNVLTGETIKL